MTWAYVVSPRWVAHTLLCITTFTCCCECSGSGCVRCCCWRCWGGFGICSSIVALTKHKKGESSNSVTQSVRRNIVEISLRPTEFTHESHTNGRAGDFWRHASSGDTRGISAGFLWGYYYITIYQVDINMRSDRVVFIPS